jgi:transcription elongation regulator 1
MKFINKKIFFFRSELIPPTNENENNENEAKLIQNTNERLNNTKESIYEAEAKAAKQRELIPYETRIKQFREMLAEKQVNLELIFIFHQILFFFC